MGVEQARQPPLSSSSKVSGTVDRWWDIAVGSQIRVECRMSNVEESRLRDTP